MRGLIWGVTGTRQGATGYQLASVAWLFSRYGIAEQHNGDCVGVDEQLYHLGHAFGAHIHLHPPKNNEYRAFCGDRFNNENQDHWWPEKEYLERDRSIVLESCALVGCPCCATEETSGGTWYTINYARALKRPIAIIWPNGCITYENWTLEKTE